MTSSIPKRARLILAWALSVLLVVALAGETLSVVALHRQDQDKAERFYSSIDAGVLSMDAYVFN